MRDKRNAKPHDFVLGRGGDIGRALPSLILLSLDGEPRGERSLHETAI